MAADEKGTGTQRVSKRTRSMRRPGEPLAFEEDFHRAKRNALFWAATVTVLAVGTADGKQIEPTILEGVSLHPELLLWGLLLVLVMMFLAFLRADGRMKRFHKDRVVAADLSTAAEVAAALNGEIGNLRRRVDAILRNVDRRAAIADEAWKYVATLAENEPVIERPEVPDELWTTMQKLFLTEPSRRHGSWSDNAAQAQIDFDRIARKAIEEDRANQRAAIETHWPKMIAKLDEATAPLPSDIAELDDVDLKSAGLSTAITKWSGKLDQTDKLWYWITDFGLVWAAFLVAVALSIWHLADNGSLASNRDSLFPIASSEQTDAQS